MFENILNGLLLGGLYLGCGTNLAVPVIAHAFSDTLDFLLIPGLRFRNGTLRPGVPKGSSRRMGSAAILKRA